MPCLESTEVSSAAENSPAIRRSTEQGQRIDQEDDIEVGLCGPVGTDTVDCINDPLHSSLRCTDNYRNEHVLYTYPSILSSVSPPAITTRSNNRLNSHARKPRRIVNSYSYSCAEREPYSLERATETNINTPPNLTRRSFSIAGFNISS